MSNCIYVVCTVYEKRILGMVATKSRERLPEMLVERFFAAPNSNAIDDIAKILKDTDETLVGIEARHADVDERHAEDMLRIGPAKARFVPDRIGQFNHVDVVMVTTRLAARRHA